MRLTFIKAAMGQHPVAAFLILNKNEDSAIPKVTITKNSNQSASQIKGAIFSF
jgi:hypothetical protein